MDCLVYLPGLRAAKTKMHQARKESHRDDDNAEEADQHKLPSPTSHRSLLKLTGVVNSTRVFQRPGAAQAERLSSTHSALMTDLEKVERRHSSMLKHHATDQMNLTLAARELKRAQQRVYAQQRVQALESNATPREINLTEPKANSARATKARGARASDSLTPVPLERFQVLAPTSTIKGDLGGGSVAGCCKTWSMRAQSLIPF